MVAAMSGRIFKLLLILALSLLPIDGYGQCESQIKDFYISYMNNVENDECTNELLISAHMTPELIDKLKENIDKHGFDAVINAQDVCEYAINSLRVTPLEACYIVSYKWSEDSKPTNICVKATNSDGILKFTDIIPLPIE